MLWSALVHRAKRPELGCNVASTSVRGDRVDCNKQSMSRVPGRPWYEDLNLSAARAVERVGGIHNPAPDNIHFREGLRRRVPSGPAVRISSRQHRGDVLRGV